MTALADMRELVERHLPTEYRGGQLLKPLFHIRGEILEPAYGSHFDLNMLAI